MQLCLTGTLANIWIMCVDRVMRKADDRNINDRMHEGRKNVVHRRDVEDGLLTRSSG